MEHKEALKKVISCFKKAGIDVSTVSDVKADSVHVEFNIEIKNKDVTVGIKFDNGDVYYQYFTSQSKIGNVSDLSKLTATIKDGATDKEIAPNIEEKVKRLKEAIKKAIKSHLDEESSTGTGATFNAGQGEQYATPKAFSKKGAINRATSYLIKQGYMMAPDSLRHKAKTFDIEKWK